MSTTTNHSDDWLDGAVSVKPNAGGRPLKDGRGRQRKLECPSCGFIARATTGAIERAGGFPSCACGERMTAPVPRDRAVLEPDAFERELSTMTRSAARETAYAAGYDRAAASALLDRTHGPATRDHLSGADRMRCRWAAGYCTRWAASGSGFCNEHGDDATRWGA